MLKSIMLTIFGLCVILTCVGCENGKINIDESFSGEIENLYSSGDEETSGDRK